VKPIYLIYGAFLCGVGCERILIDGAKVFEVLKVLIVFYKI
jgi:hypothetical protein